MALQDGFKINEVAFIYQIGTFNNETLENIIQRLNGIGLNEVHSFNNSAGVSTIFNSISGKTQAAVVMSNSDTTEPECQPCNSQNMPIEEIHWHESFYSYASQILQIVGDECEIGACIGTFKICCNKKK